MANARHLYSVVVLWGEKSSGNRFYLQMILTEVQFRNYCKNDQYREYLLWEFNVRKCEQEKTNYQLSCTEAIEHDSPPDKTLDMLLAGHGKTRSHLQSINLSGPEFHPPLFTVNH